ncbi:MAG: 1-phosphofructokinase family hexose kinase, partial [Ignavibacteria bacterium]|nr:1-phosphofructokinase family hexose kinase [Ignavibacteria bacterium]
MILTITLNPLLEKVLYFNQVKLGEVNRAYKVKLNAGGKGINVSRQLNMFKLDNLATGFLGGENGKRLKHILHQENIKNSFVQIKSETREGIVIRTDSSNDTSFFDPNPIIEKGEIKEFIEKSLKFITNSEMVIFSGSQPNDVDNTYCKEIFTTLINFANENDKIVILDIYGKNLNEILKAEPLIVHFNKSEAEDSFSVRLNDKNSILKFLQKIYEQGIKIFILTDGENTFYAINQGFIYEVTPIKVHTINSTGSGDAFMAGLIYGFHKNLPFEDIIRFATA